MTLRALGLIFVLLAPALPVRAEAPNWLTAVAATAPGGNTEPAEVLLAERTVRFSSSGKAVITERRAVRVLRSDGRSSAVAWVPYDVTSDRVRDLRAWVVSAGGAHAIPSNRVVDIARLGEHVYSELRIRGISGSDDAAPGSVFGYEWTLESKQVFAQFVWPFQDDLACRVSRFTIEPPRGWTAAGVMFHHAPVPPQIEQDRYTWELRDLPALHEEPASPPATSLVPRLAASCSPPSGSGANDVVCYSDWTDVARWLDRLTGPMNTPTPEVEMRARESVRGARTTLDTLRSVGRWVQRVRYASIPLGLSQGGGYRPVPAATTLARGYGDCKDKANLMRSMLTTLGFEAHLVPVFAGDPQYAEEAWPSPAAFNHCVIAIRPRGGVQIAAVVEDPAIGTLMLFDPTDPYTAFGDLPEAIQGSLALVVAPNARSPVRIPRLPGTGMEERRMMLELDANGGLTGRLDSWASGPIAAPLRRILSLNRREGQQAALERWLSQSASGARIRVLEARDDSLADRVTTHVEFDLAPYGQLLGNRLLMFRPFLLPSASGPVMALSEPRRHPIVIPTQALRETVIVRLPSGYRVDEIPSPIVLDASFGRYAAAVRRAGADLELTRTLDVRSERIPADQVVSARDFFRAIRKFEESPVVLARD